MGVFVAICASFVLVAPQRARALLKSVKIGHRTVWLLVPAATPPRGGFPLVVALHWAGARGKSYVPAWESWYRDARAIVALPTALGTRWHSADRHHVLETVEYVRLHYRVDKRRIYLAGFSRGGSFTYAFGMDEASPFVAVAPMAAGLVSVWQTKRHFDVCIVHGADDRLVRPRRSAWMVPRLRRMGHHVEYFSVRGMGHRHDPRITPHVFRCLDRRYQQWRRHQRPTS
ncbi:MAG: hypothetical protein KC609_12055 [Myxococcales bacterium]|nr:hypothetical protein [Myxococcales bacterium]